MSIINANPLLAAAGGDYQISRSVRLRSSASAYFNRTPASAGNRKTWTWSAWVKRGTLGVASRLFAADDGSASTDQDYNTLLFNSSNQLQFSGNLTDFRITTAVYRDPSAWYHIVLATDTTQATAANRFKLYVNGSEVTAFGTSNNPSQNTDLAVNASIGHYIGSIAGSSYLDGYLTEINFIDGQALTPSSFGETDAATGVWKPKKYAGTYGTNGFYLPFTNTATTGGNGFTYSEDFGNAAWTKYQSTVTTDATTAPNGTTTADKLIETATTGDHQVSRTFAATDNTAYTWSAYAKQGERSNFRMYLQNKAGTYNYADFDLSTGTIGTQTGVTAVMTSVGNGWYRCSVSCNAGTGATASPVAILSYATAFTGSGTNGLYIWGAQLEGSTSVPGAYYTTTSAGFGTYQIGADQSLATGGYNSWVANNISLTAGVTYDSMIDVPTPYADGGNGRGNYAVLNPLDGAQYSGVRNTLTNGNLTATFNVAGSSNSVSSFVMPTGRWYCEFTVGARTSPIWFGAQDQAGFTGNGSAYNSSGDVICNGTTQGTYATFTAGDIIGCAYDITNNQVSFYKNGIQQGTTGTLGVTTKTYNIWVQINATNDFINANFGQRPFAYTPPTGFVALNTQNLPESTIKKGNQYFDAALYSGGAGDVSVTGLGFTPDFTWLKARSIGFDHGLYDSVRGATKELMSQSTAAETTQATGLKSFDASGFTVGGRFSGAGNTYASWNWKESASAGFDIVTFTNPSSGSSSFAHNLGVKPSMIIVKSRSNTSNWTTMHKSLGTNMADNWINLESTAAKQTSTNIWGGEPTSSVFFCGTGIQVAGATMVAYLFAEVAGFSRFGSYTGNGSTDGPFVFTGFRPRWVMFKCSSNADYWLILDTARDTYNTMVLGLKPNASDAEASVSIYNNIDVTANGFKLRGTDTTTNGSARTYIYAAFAENPFKNSLAR